MSPDFHTLNPKVHGIITDIQEVNFPFATFTLHLVGRGLLWVRGIMSPPDYIETLVDPKRSRYMPWFGARKEYAPSTFAQKLKEAEKLYKDSDFPMLYYKGFHATTVGGDVNETVLEHDYDKLRYMMQSPDYHNFDRHPGETRADAKMRHHFEMYGGKPLASPKNSMKVRFLLQCGCMLEQRFDYYKTAARRARKTILSRNYPRQENQSENVSCNGFFELIADVKCTEHYPQLDTFGMHGSLKNLVGKAFDIEGPPIGRREETAAPYDPRKPVQKVEDALRNVILSTRDALEIVKLIGQRTR